MKKHAWLLLISASLLMACTKMPPGVYYNRGDPEKLLDVSSEIVTMGLVTPTSLTDLANTVRQDPPTRAELHCSTNDVRCNSARSLLEKHGIQTAWGKPHSKPEVTLFYQRILAHDCENRYIDNSINPYNLEPPTFGCSVTGNTVQMVSDKRQFVNPSLLDFQDGDKAEQNYSAYLKPTPAPSDQGSTSIIGSSTSGTSSGMGAQY